MRQERGLVASSCLTRRRWRRPVAAPIGVCRSCFQVAALLSAIRLPWWSRASVRCSGFCAAISGSPLRRCWIDHPYGEEEITRLEDELLPVMESLLSRIVDVVFREAIAIDQQLREAQEEQEAQFELERAAIAAAGAEASAVLVPL